MKKAFDQTVRDLKREVNKKVLKVPSIEQKILDATSNETWGPHGAILADIAHATRNYNEYQMIMNVIWKRINDTGKNWRHVYKALIVLDYLVAHGTDRIIDDIREHAYQISTLSDFQYIDSSGRDQGSNVRRKSQSLVVLVNDKERVQEVRQKALANRDKYRSAFSTGGTNRPSSYSGTGGYGDRYDDDRNEGRYGNRDDDRYGREREWGYKDDDKYGRYGDSHSRDGDGDRYGKESDERYGRDNYREDESRGNDDYPYGSRNRSYDREKDHSNDDDDRYSSRSGGGRADETSSNGRRSEPKISEQNEGAPPSYEEAIQDAQVHSPEERNGGNGSPVAPKASSPSAPQSSSSLGTKVQGSDNVVSDISQDSAPNQNRVVDGFDEFDPRGSFSAASPAASTLEMDLFGSLPSSDPISALALMPVTSSTTTEADIPATSGFEANSFVALPSAPTVFSQHSENPFGDPPFRAIAQENIPVQSNSALISSFQTPGSTGGTEPLPPLAPKMDTGTSFDFGDALGDLTYTPSIPSAQQDSFANHAFFAPEMHAMEPSTDITGTLPQTGAVTFIPPQAAQPAVPPNLQAVHPSFYSQFGLPTLLVPQATPDALHAAQPEVPTNLPTVHSSFLPQSGLPAALAPQAIPAALQTVHPSFLPQSGLSASLAQPAVLPNLQTVHSSFLPQSGLSAPLAPQATPAALQSVQPVGPTNMQASNLNLLSQMGSSDPLPSESVAMAALQAAKTQPVKKFETKSTVWADTLNRGLVNLNISGPKINPHADLGIDFDSINRKEKREEKKSVGTPVTSTITMGKAMGTGSGIGRVGAGGLAAPPNPMVGSGMGMGMGMGGSPGMGMGMGMGGGVGTGMTGYGGSMNQPMSMGMSGYGGNMNQPMSMGMGMNIGAGMGRGMNMGMGQGMPMRPPMGMPPAGPAMPPGVGYNPTMGTGYGPQQQYGGGYR